MEYVLGNFQQPKWRKWLPYRVGKFDCGCVYVVEYTKDFLKIGATKNPFNRFQCLEREKLYGDGVRLQRFMLTKPFVGYKDFEKIIHKAFKSVRKGKTELFESDLMLAVEVIKNLADKEGYSYCEFENGINNLTHYDLAIIRKFLR